MLRKPIFWIVLVVILGLAGGGYYYFTTTQAKASSAKTAQTLQTSRVTRGNLTISAAGTGTLIPASTIDLAFTKSGTLAEVDVQVGDKVTQGQVLAKLGNLESLEATIASDQLAVLTAQQTLDNLYKNLETDRANAQQTLVTAQKTLLEANAYRDNYAGLRCDTATQTLYYGDLVTAQNAYDKVNNDFLTYYTELPENDPRRINAYAKVYSANTTLQTALRNYNYCTGGSTDTWTTSNLQAAAAVAQAAYDTAKSNLEALKNGPDPIAIAQAQAKLDAAKNQLTTDQKTLTDTTMLAPIDGVVTAVNFQVGETVNGTFITIADTLHPMMTMYMDETDLNNVAKNMKVNVVFDALPEKTFTGAVTQLDPALSSQGGVAYVKGTVKFDDTSAKIVSTLPTGMSAAVDVISGQADNAMLIPVEALRTLGTNEYAVFVQQSDGKLRLVPINIGLQSVTQVQVLTGLNLGDVVSLGTTTSATSSMSSKTSTGTGQ